MPSMLRVLFPYVLIFTLTVISSNASADTFNSEAEKSHGSWYSLYLHLGTDRRARAVNTKRNGETLVLDIPISDCNSYAPQLQLSFDSSADRTITGDALGVNARIDRHPEHNLDAQITVQRGERTMYIPFTAQNPPRLWREIREGSTIRFEVKLKNDENAYTSFSLDGSAAATARAKAICKQRSPSSYFDDDEHDREPDNQEDKPDSEYF